MKKNTHTSTVKNTSKLNNSLNSSASSAKRGTKSTELQNQEKIVAEKEEAHFEDRGRNFSPSSTANSSFCSHNSSLPFKYKDTVMPGKRIVEN